MKPIVPFLLATVLLAGCAPLAQQARPEPAVAQPATDDREQATAEERETPPAKLPAVELTPSLLYRLLLAEIAGQRGQSADAAAVYLALAEETRDPRIARRATEIALHARQTQVALQAARLWLRADPDSLPARQAVASLLAVLGRFEELKALLPQLLAAEPQALGRNLLHLNRLFSRGGDRAAVRAAIDDVTAPYLKLPEAHYARAQAAREAGDLPAARAAIGQALELRPDWEAAALLRAQLTAERHEALVALRIFLDANPRARDARQTYARMLIEEKRYDEARREFRLLLDQSAAEPARRDNILFALAMLSLQLNDTQEAEKHLRNLAGSGHGEADKARLFLGQIAADGKRWDEALGWFLAVGRGEHYLTARLRAANVYAQQGRLDAARELLTTTETATPEERVPLLLGEAQLLREAGRNADAHAVLAAALERYPDQPELLYEIALLAERLGRHDELESRLRRLIELRPDHAHALNALGYSFADRNIRLDEARALIEKAAKLAPDDPFILDSKGWLLFRRGEAQAALEVLNRAFGMRPDPEIAAHVGEVLWSLGRRDEARHIWEKARREFPANEVLAETIKRLDR